MTDQREIQSWCGLTNCGWPEPCDVHFLLDRERERADHYKEQAYKVQRRLEKKNAELLGALERLNERVKRVGLIPSADAVAALAKHKERA